MGKPCETLTLAEIQTINKNTIQQFGGVYTAEDNNMLNSGSLMYILEAVVFPMYGQDLYPCIYNKVAAIVHTIICKHVFKDGNKRTALSVCHVIMQINGFIFEINKTREDFFVEIADKNIPIESIAIWIKKNSKIKFVF